MVRRLIVVEKIRPRIGRLWRIRRNLPHRLSRGMIGHHQQGRHLNSGGGGLRSFFGHLHDMSHPEGAAAHRGSDYEEQQLTCIAEYTGITEDELKELIAEVDAEFGPEKRADKAYDVITRIVDEERAA